MTNKELVILGIIGIGGYLLLTRSKAASAPNTSAMRQALVQWANSGGDTQQSKDSISALFLNTMTDQEIQAVYDFAFNYVKLGKKLTPGTALYNQIQAISTKYNIFT